MFKSVATFRRTHALWALIGSSFLGLATAMPAHAQDTLVVEQRPIGAAISLGGTVIPHMEVNLVAQVPGEIEIVGGVEGDRFLAGEPLAQINVQNLIQKRRQAETQLASAEANLYNAQIQLEREMRNPNSQSNSMMGGLPSMMTMFTDPMRDFSGRGDTGFERHSNVVQMQTGVEAARNGVEQAKAAIAELDESIKDSTIRAPFDGVILRKMVDIGQPVMPGTPIFAYGDTDALQLRVEVPTRLARALRPGLDVRTRLDSGLIITTSVDRVFPMADPGAHTVTVKFNLPQNADATAGMYAEVMLPDPSARQDVALTVPMDAVSWRGSLPAVFVVRADGSLEMRLVRLGDRTPTGEIIVLAGLKEGEQILAKPTSTTRSGPAQ
ncbi:MAG: efflux RND transporter periplasmic adaptor subunit [Gammaproteobacteria bacterium]